MSTVDSATRLALPAETSYEAVWDDIYRGGYYTHYPSEPVVRFVFRRFPDRALRRRATVLDMGCGTGNNTWMLAREGFEVHALDGSAAALDLNRRRLAAMNLQAQLTHADFLHLPYAPNSFDAVIDDAAIEANTLSNIRLILTEVWRVLKPGGVYFGRLMSAASRGVGDAAHEIEPNTFSQTHGILAGRRRTVHLSSREELLAGCSAAGFADVSLGYLELGQDGSDERLAFWLVEAQKADVRGPDCEIGRAHV